MTHPDCEGCRKKETDRQYHMNAINRLAKRIDMLGETSDAVIEKALRLLQSSPAPAKSCAEVTLTEEERRDLKIISRPNSGPVQNRMAALINRLLGPGETK